MEKINPEFITTMDGVSPLTAFIVFTLVIISTVAYLVKTGKKADITEKNQFIGILKEVIIANNETVRQQIKESSDSVSKTVESLTRAIDKLGDNMFNYRDINITILENIKTLNICLKEHEDNGTLYRQQFRDSIEKQNAKIEKIYYEVCGKKK